MTEANGQPTDTIQHEKKDNLANKVWNLLQKFNEEGLVTIAICNSNPQANVAIIPADIEAGRFLAVTQQGEILVAQITSGYRYIDRKSNFPDHAPVLRQIVVDGDYLKPEEVLQEALTKTQPPVRHIVGVTTDTKLFDITTLNEPDDQNLKFGAETVAELIQKRRRALETNQTSYRLQALYDSLSVI